MLILFVDTEATKEALPFLKQAYIELRLIKAANETHKLITANKD